MRPTQPANDNDAGPVVWNPRRSHFIMRESDIDWVHILASGLAIVMAIALMVEIVILVGRR